MRKLILLLLAPLAFAAAAPAPAATTTVSITRAGFIPNPVNIQVGDAVTWTNSDTVNRQVVSNGAGFASPILKPGESYSFTFGKAGRFAYQDPLVRARPRGTVTVARPPAGSVTIAVSRGMLIFGGSAALTGTVSNGKAGETVTIVAGPTGEPAARTDVTTTTDGAWRLVVRPHILTSYKAQWGDAASSTVSIKVRPRISLRKVAARRFATSVVAAETHAGRYVDFRRWSINVRRWLLVKRVFLNRSTVDENVAVASFRAKVRKGRKLRVFMPQSQVRPGYVAGHSNFIVN